jgi:hypothetical protein
LPLVTDFHLSSLAFRLLGQSFGRMLNRVDDVLIARAAAEIAVNSVADLIFRRLWIPYQQLVRGENHSRSAKTALKTVAFPKRLLNRMEFLSLGQALDGQNIGAVRLDRKDRARLDRRVVEHDRARPADTGLAADVGARQPDDVPQKMDQQQPRFHFAGLFGAIDPDRNLLFRNCVHLARPYLNDKAAIKFFVLLHRAVLDDISIAK